MSSGTRAMASAETRADQHPQTPLPAAAPHPFGSPHSGHRTALSMAVPRCLPQCLNSSTDGERCLENRAEWNEATEPIVSKRLQSDRRDATTLRTVWIPPVLARRDRLLEVSRKARRCLGEDA